MLVDVLINDFPHEGVITPCAIEAQAVEAVQVLAGIFKIQRDVEGLFFCGVSLITGLSFKADADRSVKHLPVIGHGGGDVRFGFIVVRQLRPPVVLGKVQINSFDIGIVLG